MKINIARLFQSAKTLVSSFPYHFAASGWALPPLNVTFFLTLRCNLRCRGCFIELHGQGDRQPPAEKSVLSEQEIKSLVDATPRFSILTFTGGEPLMRDDCLAIVRYAAARRRCHLITNGTLLTAEKATALVALRAKGIFGRGLLAVGVSVNGLGESHDRVTRVAGSFDRTIEGIRLLRRAKDEAGARFPLIDLKVVLREECVDVLPQLCSLAAELRADIVSLQILSQQDIPVYDPQRPPEYHDPASLQEHRPPPVQIADPQALGAALRELEAERASYPFVLRFLPPLSVPDIVDYYAGKFDPELYRCTAPWNTMNIAPNGDVVPCFGYPAANVRERSLAECWNGPGMRKLRMALRRRRSVFPGCAGCCLLEPKRRGR